jgi:hypothetical protein
MLQKVGQRQMLTLQAARFAPQQLEMMFQAMERFARDNSGQLDWSTLELTVKRGSGISSDLLEFMMEMEADIDVPVQRDTDFPESTT